MIQLGMAMVVVATLLFVVAFISKRRFGLLGMALASGSVLSGLWAQYAGEITSFLGVERASSNEAMIGVILIILPAMITLLHGYTYKTLLGRILGALSFAILAVAFLSEPMGYAFVNTGSAGEMVAIFDQYRHWIVGGGIIIAVFDLLFSKPNLFPKKR